MQPERAPLTLKEATSLLETLEKEKTQGRITGSVYERKRVRILARINEQGPQQSHRYVTRRQIKAAMPLPATPRPPPLDTGRVYQAQQAQKKLAREASKRDLNDFIVNDDDESDDSYRQHRRSREDDEGTASTDCTTY